MQNVNAGHFIMSTFGKVFSGASEHQKIPTQDSEDVLSRVAYVVYESVIQANLFTTSHSPQAKILCFLSVTGSRSGRAGRG